MHIVINMVYGIKKLKNKRLFFKKCYDIFVSNKLLKRNEKENDKRRFQVRNARILY